VEEYLKIKIWQFRRTGVLQKRFLKIEEIKFLKKKYADYFRALSNKILFEYSNFSPQNLLISLRFFRYSRTYIRAYDSTFLKSELRFVFCIFFTLENPFSYSKNIFFAGTPILLDCFKF